MGAAWRGLLLDQWRGIQDDGEVYDDHGDPSAVKHRRRRLNQAKEQWRNEKIACYVTIRGEKTMQLLESGLKVAVEVCALLCMSQHDEFEAKFFEERAALEAKYQKMYEPLYSKRHDVVNGVVEVEGVTKDDSGEAASDQKGLE
ncbi:Nucleosome assembly protein 1-like protein 1 [Hordeum vulgare]|nr:Nucleosome assembly protein 1-like protein 1 [Hordeum vulgare]